ncbi:hypothetical protein ABC977_16530 [Thioalkalicoccus limnaeus]|uniref:DUF1618 domain-containing protein n=1 Tax=Thioalkalicoccus limnaeus TaxID=120681 RepID=A0ABV4BHJ3_9GAMM
MQFFAVDGSHLYRVVMHDLDLAARTLTWEGVIAVDAFCNRDWPGVSFAIYDPLFRSDLFLAFAVTSSKLYLVAPEFA